MTTRTKKTAAENVNEVVNTAAQETTQVPEMIGAFGEDYSATVKVAKAIAGTYENRVAFVIDGTPIAGYDETNAESAVTTFGINVNELCNQVRNQVPELAMFETAAMGKRINPQVVGFIFQGAELQIERVFKEKGEEREVEGTGVYSNDCFVTKIKKVTTHIPQQVANLLNTLLMQQCLQSTMPVSAFNVR